MILRPVNGRLDGVTDEIKPDTYHFVTSCYLSGFMNGEGAERDAEWKKVYLR